MLWISEYTPPTPTLLSETSPKKRSSGRRVGYASPARLFSENSQFASWTDAHMVPPPRLSRRRLRRQERRRPQPAATMLTEAGSGMTPARWTGLLGSPEVVTSIE